MDETIDEVVYYLKLLNFLHPDQLVSSDLARLSEWLSNTDIITGDALQVMPNVIREVDDAVMRIALLRDAKFITKEGNHCVYNKRHFKFDNVFTDDTYDDMLLQIVEFVGARVAAERDTTLFLFGYSGSGKSYLTKRIVESYSNVSSCRYKLFEIYNNKVFVFFQGTRCGLTDEMSVKDDKYTFYSSDILSVVSRFERKCNNGLNSNSSRSHLVLELIMPTCKITIVDSAGNERLLNADATETKYINSSLYNICRLIKIKDKYKEKGCKLTNIVRCCRNIIFLTILKDNDASLAANHLMLLA